MSTDAHVQAFRPRTKVEPHAVGLINRLARSRQPLTATVEGLNLRITLKKIHLGPIPSTADDAEICFRIGEPLNLSLPANILDRISSKIQDDITALPRGVTGAMMIELALAPLLEAMEQIAGVAISVEQVGSGTERSERIVLIFDGILGDATFEARLGLRTSGVASMVVASLIEAMPRKSFPLPELFVPVRFLAGATRITARQLAQLCQGDVLVPDVWHPANGELCVTFATTHLAMGATDSQKVILKSQIQRNPVEMPNIMKENFPKNDFSKSDGPENSRTSLDAIELTLAFELGRRSATIAEIQSIGAGHVFDLGRWPDEAIDIVANGARIGVGEIVEIGERVGVRIKHLFGQEQDPLK